MLVLSLGCPCERDLCFFDCFVISGKRVDYLWKINALVRSSNTRARQLPSVQRHDRKLSSWLMGYSSQTPRFALESYRRAVLLTASPFC